MTMLPTCVEASSCGSSEDLTEQTLPSTGTASNSSNSSTISLDIATIVGEQQRFFASRNHEKSQRNSGHKAPHHANSKLCRDTTTTKQRPEPKQTGMPRMANIKKGTERTAPLERSQSCSKHMRRPQQASEFSPAPTNRGGRPTMMRKASSGRDLKSSSSAHHRTESRTRPASSSVHAAKLPHRNLRKSSSKQHEQEPPKPVSYAPPANKRRRSVLGKASSCRDLRSDSSSSRGAESPCRDLTSPTVHAPKLLDRGLRESSSQHVSAAEQVRVSRNSRRHGIIRSLSDPALASSRSRGVHRTGTMQKRYGHGNEITAAAAKTKAVTQRRREPLASRSTQSPAGNSPPKQTLRTKTQSRKARPTPAMARSSSEPMLNVDGQDTERRARQRQPKTRSPGKSLAHSSSLHTQNGKKQCRSIHNDPTTVRSKHDSAVVGVSDEDVYAFLSASSSSLLSLVSVEEHTEPRAANTKMKKVKQQKEARRRMHAAACRIQASVRGKLVRTRLCIPLLECRLRCVRHSCAREVERIEAFKIEQMQTLFREADFSRLARENRQTSQLQHDMLANDATHFMIEQLKQENQDFRRENAQLQQRMNRLAHSVEVERQHGELVESLEKYRTRCQQLQQSSYHAMQWLEWEQSCTEKYWKTIVNICRRLQERDVTSDDNDSTTSSSSLTNLIESLLVKDSMSVQLNSSGCSH